MRWVVFVVVVIVGMAVFADEIVQRVGSGEQVLKGIESIGTETYKEVNVKIGGSFQKIPAENIIDIKREKSSLVYQSAEELRAQGNYAEALKKYEAAMAREGEEWEKIYSAYYKSLCLQMLGTVEPARLKDAVKSYKEFIEKWKEHRLVPHAHQGRGISAMGSGDWAEAQDAFTKLSGGEYGSYWRLRGKYWLGELAYRRGELANAKKIWAEILAEAERMGMKDVRAKYELVTALEELDKGNTAKAKSSLEKIVDIGLGGMDPSIGYEVLAKAHKALGDCYYKEAGGDKAKMRKALFEYLKVILLYSLSKQEYIHSLQMAIEISKKLDSDDDKKRVDDLSRELAKARGS
ncbi:MAG: tetratricopeptide repeat protein [Planctomycetota bacterium]|nr:tetratricopeptide repeat protein [Planctomycetota bacterium]